MSAKLGIYLFLMFSLAAGCERQNIGRENSAKKSVDSIPMESVDAETGGDKGGGTHFHVSSNELFLDYTYFDDAAGANRELDKRTATAKQVIEQGDVSGDAGEIVGKFVVTETTSTYPNDRFCVQWSKANRYSQVCSEFRQGLDEFRTVYEF